MEIMKQKYYLIDTENVGDRWIDFIDRLKEEEMLQTGTAAIDRDCKSYANFQYERLVSFAGYFDGTGEGSRPGIIRC